MPWKGRALATRELRGEGAGGMILSRMHGADLRNIEQVTFA